MKHTEQQPRRTTFLRQSSTKQVEINSNASIRETQKPLHQRLALLNKTKTVTMNKEGEQITHIHICSTAKVF